MKNIIVLALIIVIAFNLSAADKAGDFKLENIDGKQVKLSDLQKEGLVILDFWATWCVPCKNGLPKLNELHKKYDNVTVVAVCADKPRKKDKAVSHIKSNRFSFVTLFDTKSVVQKMFNVSNIPRTIFITPDSNIIYDHTGYQRGDEKHYEEIIIKWLDGQKADTTKPEQQESEDQQTQTE